MTIMIWLTSAGQIRASAGGSTTLEKICQGVSARLMAASSCPLGVACKPARTISQAYAPRFNTMASTQASSTDRRTPMEGKPKNIKNNWMMNGVLRTSSTYRPTTRFKTMLPCNRAQAQAVPNMAPSTAEAAVSTMVRPSPRISMGHWANTTAKLNSIMVNSAGAGATGLIWQNAGAAAQEFLRILLQRAICLGHAQNVIHLGQQSAFTLAHTNEVGRVFQQQLV